MKTLSPSPGVDLSLLENLSLLAESLKKTNSVQEKLDVLNADIKVIEFLSVPSFVRTFLSGLSPECELVIKSIIAIGQDKKVFHIPAKLADPVARLRSLIETLLPVEEFYAEIGGIVGYQWMMLHLLSLQEKPQNIAQPNYLRPEGVDISEDTLEVRRALIWGIMNLPKMAEIYPLGGAADRLRLRDETTALPLPAARLMFLGRTLLEGMISDLQAREYLHYKICGKQSLTPVAMMTSREKDNHAQIIAICEELKWFGRPKESFKLFCQHSVPTLNHKGAWCLSGPLKLLLKPGGHGVIWKLARDQGVFEWLFKKHKVKALIRQVNNPIAGIDHGILAFLGLGCQEDRSFGFASCPRQIKASEGINVLIEKSIASGANEHAYLLTNIEYCDFKKFNLCDEPLEKGSILSKFSSNTNILFADLRAVEDAVCKMPIPGMLINLKKTAYTSESGQTKEEEIARLESTMQNIADAFEEVTPEILPEGKRGELKTYLTYNTRGKTISTVKREFVLGATLFETPEGCFLDVLKNARELLVEKCGFCVPEVNEGAVFFSKGPSFIFLYHPALGPLYSVIAQKLRGRKLDMGAELQLDIADIDVEELDLSGSLCISAESLMGEKNSDGILNYSEHTGKCVLKNVQVINQGIDYDSPNVFWRNEIFRKENCEIIIQGNGEFYAENVTLKGNMRIKVESGTRLVATQRGEKVHFQKESIKQPSWKWEYTVCADYTIKLAKKTY
jgi:hypothetical protein